MIHHSILITTDPDIFCPDVPALSSARGLRSFRRLISGYQDPELSRPGISLLGLLPPDTLCRHTIILISPSLRAVCPDHSLTFSILSVRSYVISRCPHDTSQRDGELSQLCWTQSRSCPRSIILFPMLLRDVYYKIAQTPRGVSLSLILLLLLLTPRLPFTFSYQHISVKQIVLIN